MNWISVNERVKFTSDELIERLMSIENGIVLLDSSVPNSTLLIDFQCHSTARRVIRIASLGAVDALVESMDRVGCLGDADLCLRARGNDAYCVQNVELLQCMENTQMILAGIMGHISCDHLIVLEGSNLTETISTMFRTLSFYDNFFLFRLETFDT